MSTYDTDKESQEQLNREIAEIISRMKKTINNLTPKERLALQSQGELKRSD